MNEDETILSALHGLHEAIKTGFATLGSQTDKANERLILRITETNECLARQLLETNDRLIQTNGHLEWLTNRIERQDHSMGSIDDDLSSLRREANQQLGGKGSQSHWTNRILIEHSERIYKLEQRMDKLEGKQGVA